jgi:hypothetical protein
VIPILLIVVPLVVLLFVLILSMSHGEHYAPQAYYRRKQVGAPVAYGLDRLGPRLRRRLPAEVEAAAQREATEQSDGSVSGSLRER